MKKKIVFQFGAAALMVMMFCGCKDTWLMYDPSQKDHLYFEISSVTPQASFALLTDNEMQFNIHVKMMGMPIDADRAFTIEYLNVVPGEQIAIGKDKYDVVTARENIDFEIDKFVIPAGQTEHTIPMTLHRQTVMKEKLVCVRFRILEDDEFLPLTPDSANLKKIKSPLFNLYINDGDPSCPDWWDASTSNQDYMGWTMYSGKFHAAKFRKMLELYHEMEMKNPIFYETCVGKYGENLDKEGITKGFFAVENAAAWSSYVLIPLYEYYKVYYAENPTDPNVEAMATSGTAGTYWKDPIALLR